MSTKSTVPSYRDLLWPTLRAVREIGDSGTIEEIVEKVIELEGFSEEQQAIPHGDGPTSEIEYRLAWARPYLKGMGALVNSKRGVWSTTELGRSRTPDEIAERHTAYLAHLREMRKAKKAAGSADDELAGDGDERVGARDWKEQVNRAAGRDSPRSLRAACPKALARSRVHRGDRHRSKRRSRDRRIGVYRLSLVSFRCSCSASDTREALARAPSAPITEARQRWGNCHAYLGAATPPVAPCREKRPRQGDQAKAVIAFSMSSVAITIFTPPNVV